MHRFRLLGLAFLVVFALGAIASSAAFAEEGGNPLLLPDVGFPVEFEGTGGAGTLVTSLKEPVTCAKAKASGLFEGTRLGNLNVTFEGCKVLEKPCENIKVEKANIHLVDILPAKVLEPGLAVTLTKTLEFLCNKLKVKVTGAVIGEIYKELLKEVPVLLVSGELVTKFIVLFRPAKKGNQVQLVKTCDLTKEFCFEEKEGKVVEKKFLLTANLGLGNEEGSEETEVTVTPNQGVRFDF